MSSVYGLKVPNDWEIVALDQIKSDEKKALISGPFGSNISAKYFTATGVPVIRGNNLSLDVFTRFKDNGFVFVSPEKADELGTWAQADDIIFTAVGTLGQIGLLSHKQNYSRYIISNKQIRLRLNQGKVTPQFVYYWLASDLMQEVIEQRNTGSSVPLINLGVVKNLLLPLPPLPEQKAIASVLSSLDDKIDLLHRQNKTLEAMAETLFRQWFIEEAKEDWEETTLERHIVALKGLSYKGSGLCDIGQGVPMFNLNSILEGGGYKTKGLKYYKGDYKERHIVKAGDIIIANTEQGHEHRLIGFPATIPSYFSGESIFTHHIFKVSLLEDTYLSNEFIYYLLCSSSVREQITGATNGSTVNQLAADGLRRPKFKLPPQKLVESFTDQATSFWYKRDLNQQQVWLLEKLRDTLLPKLMGGEIRVEYKKEDAA